MDISVILTYRCDSACSMCHIWQNPTLPREEVSPRTLERLPSGVDFLNLTGGEPTLRADLHEIVDVLYPKAATLEVSSNGLHADRLEPIIRKYPNIKIRFSAEGIGETSNRIRGEKDGFDRKVRGLLRLKELGGTDLGFAVVIQDDNLDQVVDLFRLAEKHGVELSTSTLHNAFQFHKNDNLPYDRLRIARGIERLITEMLQTHNVKNWFRAYMGLGLISKVLGHPRLLPCTAATDFAFVDPWGDVFACNVRPDLKLGNLERQSWNEIFHGSSSDGIRDEVRGCPQNCWMVGSAKTAMRHPKYARIPKPAPVWWVLKNKIRATLNQPIPFDRYIDYQTVHDDGSVRPRVFFLGSRVKGVVQTKAETHYRHPDGYFNR